MDFGRVLCVLVANKAGAVLYERFYTKLTEAEKAEIRSGLYTTSKPWLTSMPEESDRIGRFKCVAIIPAIGPLLSGLLFLAWAGVVAFTVVQDVIVYALGTGEYDELALSHLLSAIVRGLQESLKVQLNERNLIDKYSKMLLVIDEAVNEGIIDQTNPARIVAGTKLDMRSK